MRIGVLIYFILMPLVYATLVTKFCKICKIFKNEGGEENILLRRFFIIDAFIYYIPEIITFIIAYVWSGKNLFFKSQELSGVAEIFIFLSILFIAMHTLWMTATILEMPFVDKNLPIVHWFILGVLFLIYCVISCGNINWNILETMPYEVNSSTIYMQSLTDTISPSGKVTGGMFYVSGSIDSNLRIYYSFVDDDGNTIIRYIDYDENNVCIRLDDKETPRIEVYNYSKSYKGETKSYTEYILYAPTNTMDFMQLDMG